MQLKEIIKTLESLAPLAYQEEYDNAGLLTGNAQQELTGALITLDCTEAVVEEAIENNCNLIIAHHPIVFKGLKKINGSNYVERTIIKAIKHDIAIYAIHTNLDNAYQGVNFEIAKKLRLENTRVLVPKKNTLRKLVCFVPAGDTLKVENALFKAGAGNIGNYSECKFESEGVGSFRPNEKANPAIGKANQRELVREFKIEVIFPAHLEGAILRALFESHPYEEPAYDIFALENKNAYVGSGAIGTLKDPVDEALFIRHLKNVMNLRVVRCTPFIGKQIRTVAVCGGSGSFLLRSAMQAGADIYISADFKYHEFFDADNKIVIADIGHYESEVCTKDLIYDFLIEKFSNIAVRLSKIDTNPISYL